MSRRGFLKLGGAGLAGTALLGAAGCNATGGGGTRSFIYAYEQPEETSHGIAANIFQEKLEEVSGGAMAIEQYPAGQLGGEPALLQKVLSQDVDFINSSTANGSLLAPQSGVFSLHYLFDSVEHNLRVVTDQTINDLYSEMTRAVVDGGHALTLYSSPLRNFYSRDTEVRSVDDIQNQKIRVQATRTEDITFAAYGAQTVHMQFSEVFTSLQTGVIDMAENALMYYSTAGHYDVAPIMSLTEHEGNTQIIWVTDKAWNSMSEEERGWVQTAAEEVRTTASRKGFESKLEDRQEYRDEGVQFVDDVDKGSFKEISVPLQDRIAEDLGETAMQIVERVRELQ
ncbi:MAG TPA: TRAP transporter substrate-binding protein DctP [Rubrobacter sp.]|jgi:TRAP-type C4-dicarboxylate transport system substrate-binding protein|nr:TRAP transporter substrate-binding protein DctP [Rubrobacter sp.]